MNMKYSSKMTNEQIEEAVRLYYETEMSVREIGERYGVTGQAIYKHIRKAKSEQEEQVLERA